MMINILLKKFINIVPAEDTYYVIKEKPENIKFSKEVIHLNYGHLSPFKNGDIIYYQTKNRVFIWFVKYKLPPGKIHIPEGFLIARNFKGKFPIVYVYKKDNGYTLIEIVNNGIIISQIVTKDKNYKQLIQFLAKEHSLEKYEEKVVKKLPAPGVFDLLKFIEIKKLPTRYTHEVVRLMAFGTVVYVLASTFFYIFLNKKLEQEISQKSIELNSIKSQVKPVKEKLYILQQQKSFWDSFIKSELSYPDIYTVLVEIAKIFFKKNGYITRLEFNESTISLWVGLETDTSAIVNDLLKTGFFKDVKIVSSVKDTRNEKYEIVNFELYLRKKI